MQTPRKFIIAELSIRKLGSSSVLIIRLFEFTRRIISTDEDPSLQIESFAMINLRGVSTKLNKYIVFTMQTYKKHFELVVKDTTPGVLKTITSRIESKRYFVPISRGTNYNNNSSLSI